MALSPARAWRRRAVVLDAGAFESGIERCTGDAEVARCRGLGDVRVQQTRRGLPRVGRGELMLTADRASAGTGSGEGAEDVED